MDTGELNRRASWAGKPTKRRVDHAMDSFLKACGADQPPRLEIQGGARPQFALSQAFALIGRSAASDLRLNHPQVSLRHAYLQLVQGRLACFDLGARAGIQWDDGRPTRSGWLDPGRTMGIGPFTIRRINSPAANPPNGNITPLNFDWQSDGPDAFLEFPDESGGPVRWHVRRAVTLVGRAPSCRVRLPDPSVSWFHCSLVRTANGLWVVDLLSRGGLTVNGVGQRCARLEDGDELFVGRFRMIPRYMPELRRPTSNQTALPYTPPGPSSHALPWLPPPSAPTTLAPVDLTLEPEIVDLLTSQQTDANSPALIMLVEKFGQMQQQMLEQFHQTIMMMMHHMGEHYREEVRQVRAEVDRLRELSEELVALKGQLGQTVPASLPSLEASPAVVDAPPAMAPDTSPPPANGHAVASPETEPRKPSEAPSAAAVPRPGSAEDPLVMVTRRIAQIRGEQRSRWQKILDLVRAR